jgi:hypothetical protein
LKGLALAACSLVALASIGAACANDLRAVGATADPEYRLLVLGGNPVRWKVPANGLPTAVTFAFLTAPAQFPGARNCDAMLPPQAALLNSRIDAAAFRREVRAAFSTWEAAANIAFKEVAPDANPGILIGADAKARGRAFTNVALVESGSNPARANGGMGMIRQSLICLNPQKPWKIGFDGNLEVYDLRFTLTHEIGHAIGLDHPSPEGELMSFRYVEKARGLQAGDIAGAVALYGRKGEAPGNASGVVAVEAPGAVPSRSTGGLSAFGLGDATAEKDPPRRR